MNEEWFKYDPPELKIDPWNYNFNVLGKACESVMQPLAVVTSNCFIAFDYSFQSLSANYILATSNGNAMFVGGSAYSIKWQF